MRVILTQDFVFLLTPPFKLDESKLLPELWIDVLTPKQALFTKAMLERAPSKISITVTTRDYL